MYIRKNKHTIKLNNIKLIILTMTYIISNIKCIAN